MARKNSCIVFKRYLLTKYIYENGDEVEGHVTLIRYGYFTDCYVNLSFNYKGVEINKEVNLGQERINKDWSIRLIVHPKKPNHYRVLLAKDPIS